MKKVLILLAGFPGTGKSYISNLILEKENDFVIVSQDDIKENICDTYGYHNLEEKEVLIGMSWNQYYEDMCTHMKQGKRILSDYPFSEKQRPTLVELTNTYGYEVITVRLLADLDILYERQHRRDVDPTRHLSHILTSYHKGDVVKDRTTADGLLTYEEFIHRCKTRGYDTFELGNLIEADVSDFSKVNYPSLLQQIMKYI